MTSKLERLKQYTTVITNTGGLDVIVHLKPVDATISPSLLLKVAALLRYAEHPRQATAGSDGDAGLARDRFAVAVGKDILGVVPGRISTEANTRLSFDSEATLTRTHRLIELYDEQDIGRERMLIKIASTWKGIRTAGVLGREGIRANLTLLFSFAQTVACIDAGVFPISSFAGRIYNWYRKNENRDCASIEDPGVQLIPRIYRYYRANGYKTVVMGASFRNLDQIEQLTSCGRLTVSPGLLQQLTDTQGELPRLLLPGEGEPRQVFGKSASRWQTNEDTMATKKLAEDICLFAHDQEKLECQLATRH